MSDSLILHDTLCRNCLSVTVENASDFSLFINYLASDTITFVNRGPTKQKVGPDIDPNYSNN